MKPLELTIYPKDEHGDYIEDHIEARFIHAVEVVEVYGYAKRFTDAELAAEYWKAMSGIYDGNGKAARARREIINRFASAQHYDEVTA